MNETDTCYWTLGYTLNELDTCWLPIVKSWRLNEVSCFCTSCDEVNEYNCTVISLNQSTGSACMELSLAKVNK